MAPLYCKGFVARTAQDTGGEGKVRSAVNTTTALPPWRIRIQGLGPATGLTAWTLFVWVGRVRNILADEDLAGWSMTWRLALALTFVALATALALLLTRHLRSDRDEVGALLRQVAVGLAGYGIVVWVIRGTDIIVGSHPVGFKVVHAVLAVVTIALGAMVLRWSLRKS